MPIGCWKTKLCQHSQWFQLREHNSGQSNSTKADDGWKEQATPGLTQSSYDEGNKKPGSLAYSLHGMYGC